MNTAKLQQTEIACLSSLADVWMKIAQQQMAWYHYYCVYHKMRINASLSNPWLRKKSDSKKLSDFFAKELLKVA